MGLQLFYAQVTGDNILSLSAEESRHAFKVLRHKTGDIINCIDGKGNMYVAEISKISDSLCDLGVKEIVKEFGSHNWKLHMGVAILKNPDRYEWFVEKAVEIGVDRITPILATRCEKKKLNTERLKKIALSAVKQSQKAEIPYIDEISEFKKFIESYDYPQRFIAVCDNKFDRRLLHKVIDISKPTIVLVGPEGDFTDDEVKLAIENKFVPVSISSSILRTETAAVVCCQVLAQEGTEL